MKSLLNLIPIVGRFVFLKDSILLKKIQKYSYPQTLKVKLFILFENTLLYLLIGILIGLRWRSLNIEVLFFLGSLLFFLSSIELTLIQIYPTKKLGWHILKEEPIIAYFGLYHASWFCMIGYVIGSIW